MSDQTTPSANSPRQRFLFDPQWRFYQGEPDSNLAGAPKDEFQLAHLLPTPGPAGPDFDDHAWRVVDLPHDWAVEGTFDEKAEPNHGSRPTGVGWYRKSFSLAEEDRGSSFTLNSTAPSATARCGSTATWSAASPAGIPVSITISATC